MLYVFHVDAGKMLTFDMCTAVDSVQNLKEEIELQHRIPAVSQVLLVSGGEMLLPDTRVCSYSAGTDTNPIFMFSKIDLSNQPQPWPSIEPDSSVDMKDKVDQCLKLAPNYETVVRRNQVAQQFDELAKQEWVTCEKLVHEQHLQQQGWAAVVANMEDLTVDFKERCALFERAFSDTLAKRDHYLQCLANFNEDLEKLANIPILPALTKNAAKPFDIFGGDNNSFSKATPKGSSQSLAKEDDLNVIATEGGDTEIASMEQQAITLLEWISRDEKQSSLRKMAEQCSHGLEKVTAKDIEKLRADAQSAVKSASQADMKEIKGLEERLSGLEGLMQETRNYVREQSEMAQGFQQNQTRASNLGDASILPDLCRSHFTQLSVMFANHKKLRSIRTRIFNSKTELGKNLLQRLRFVTYIENKMNDLNDTLLFQHRNCERLQRHMNIIEQIHQTPMVYVTAVSEVVRRRSFSNAFLLWASDLASHLLAIYNDECTKRYEFNALLEGHFLNTLFPGMKDMPPNYAVEAPSLFDSSLPALAKADIRELAGKTVELMMHNVELPKVDTAVIEFFQSRSGGDTGHKDRVVQSGSSGYGQATNRILDINPHLKEFEKGFESETDTEEFEKVGQSPIDGRRISEGATLASSTQTSVERYLKRPDTMSICTSTHTVSMTSAETLTEENLTTTNAEIERLKEALVKICIVARDSVGALRKELETLKGGCDEDRNTIAKKLNELSEWYMKVNEEVEQMNQERIKMSMGHEIELNDMRMQLDERCHMTQQLKCELEKLEGVVAMQQDSHQVAVKTMEENAVVLSNRVRELEELLAKESADAERVIKEAKDKLNRDYNNKLDILRSRFKLMTSVDHSPSDTSLENIERHEGFDMTLGEMTIVKGALPIRGGSSRMMDGSMSTLVSGSSPRSPTSGTQDFFRRILDEKENQLDTMRSHNEQLKKENDRFKQTIMELTDTLNRDSVMQEQLDKLERERMKLEQQLEGEKVRRAQMEQSFITTPVKMEMSQHLENPKRDLMISVTSCSVGAHVLVVWNNYHKHYVILQESSTLFFLHCASYESLNLPPVTDDSIPSVLSCIGKVEHREHCRARKEDNRYRVAKGTEFYRVKVRPKSPSRKSKPFSCHGASTTTSKYDVQALLPCSGGSDGDASPAVPPTTHLVSSFAQTGTDLNPLLDEMPKDMIDSGVQSTSSTRSVFKERNVSVTDEEQPVVVVDGVEDRNGTLVTVKRRYVSESDAYGTSADVVVSQDEVNEVDEIDEVVDDDDDAANEKRTTRGVTVYEDAVADESDEEFRSLESKDDNN